MMTYIHETRVNDPRNTGVEDNSTYLSINSVGYYSIDDLRDGDLSNTFRYLRRKDYLLCLVSGSPMLVNINNEELELVEGAMLFSPGSRIQYSDKFRDGACTMYWVHFTGYGVDDLLKQCRLTAPGIFETSSINDISWIFSKMLREMNLKQIGYESVTAGLLIHLLGLINRQNKNESIRDQRILQVLDYISNNYNRRLQVSDFAKISGLSVSRFTVLFKDNVGEYPTKHLNNLRINKACELMKFSKLSIHQIALAVGFEDVFYFSRVFKKKMGIPPSHYINKINPKQSDTK